MTTIGVIAQKHHKSVIELRRYLHRFPELSNQEFNTQKHIIKELTAIGLACHSIAKTGVIAELEGGKPGKTIAIRADMDALEIVDECGKSYQSQNHGVCHACGHDGHVAMLIGVAKILVEIKEEIEGKIRFLFQPSEEHFPGGAKFMIEEGALDGVDAIIGAHLWEPMKVGTIGITFDRLMASPDEFTIKIKGRGGHGSMPQQTVDALLVGAQLTVALQTIVSRNVDPLEQAVVSLGYFRAGETFNIIPDTAVIKGTVRSFEPSIRALIFERIEQITKGICEANNASYEFEKVLGFPALINHPEYSKVIGEAGVIVLGKENVLTINPVMGGEDFSYYLEKVPGAFFFIGVGNVEKGIIYPQHHPKYDIDEDALCYGMEIMATAALALAHK
ncbi:amidohydrolase [Pelosinus sp. IPA-1]|uniref:M20 metallopeptidase family protein n=1 Tax=Pelosinus sp. IPA-1 TaxID=3029569 RepID=UPI002436267A|nr:amidohydrolase [Pelosinus sp. IPA-1]GMA97386.1 N-acyl-L-amino acid amidohydrolase [Pelosinus sp. IPA-1]